MTSTTGTTTATSATTTAIRPAVLPCHADPDLWFAKDNDDTTRAKSACLPCPIRSACLSAAVDRGEPWGVWGGELLSAGQVIPRQPRRGRPPKVRVDLAV